MAKTYKQYTKSLTGMAEFTQTKDGFIEIVDNETTRVRLNTLQAWRLYQQLSKRYAQ